MRAAGLNKQKLLLPLFLVSAVLSTSMYFLSQEVIPYTNREFKRQLNFLTSSGLIAAIKPGQFFSQIPGITLFPQKVSPDGRDLEDVFLHLIEKTGEKVIMAKRGELIYERDASLLVEKLTLKLFDGGITTTKDSLTKIEKVLFKSYTLPISQSKFSDRITPKETMLNSQELYESQKMTPEEAKLKYGFKEKDLFNAQYEFWNRKNTPIVCILLTFLGFGLGIKENRGKGRNSAGWGLLSLILFYGLFFALVGASKGGKFPLGLAMLIPDLVLLGLGIHFYRKLDWQS